MISLEQLQDGIVLPVDKPRQWTSFQAVNKIKAVVRNTYGLKKFKIGHAGTLDPLATGLLLVCLGKATKSIPQLQDSDKVYSGTLVLGATTPCFDLERPVDHYYPYEHITRELLETTAQNFTGTILQTPPLFSAVKVDGQRAYELARDNSATELRSKPVAIYSIEITDFRPGKTSSSSPTSLTSPASLSSPSRNLYKAPQGVIPEHLPQADFCIRCGKGTYIRSLARDLGIALGSGAFLSALRREQIGTYSIDQALQLDQIENYFIS